MMLNGRSKKSERCRMVRREALRVAVGHYRHLRGCTDWRPGGEGIGRVSYPLEAGWKDTSIASRDDRSPVVREVGEHALYSLWPEIARAALSISVGRRVSTTRWATVCYRIYHRSAMLSLHTPFLRRVDQPLAGHGTAAGCSSRQSSGAGGTSREQPVSNAPN